jgi:hypothetical protein
MWGFWQGSMWQPAGALVDRHWNIRPNGQAWLDLVKKRWWTDKVVITDSSGLAKIRVFKGQYEIDAGKAKKAISILAGTELKLRG